MEDCIGMIYIKSYVGRWHLEENICVKRWGETLEISINALLWKFNKGDIRIDANYLEIGGLYINCKRKYMAPVQG